MKRESHTFMSFWYGDTISPYEAMCFKSFLDHGHAFELYTYKSDLDVPSGVRLRDASEILDQRDYFTYQSGPGVGSHALFSNLFRYKLLSERGGWWVDTDVICLSKDIPSFEQFFAFQDEEEEVINGAILYFRPDDPIVHACLAEALSVGGGAQWGEVGPLLVTRMVRESNRLSQAYPTRVCYPIHYSSALDVMRPSKTRLLEERTKPSIFLHLWNEMLRRGDIAKTILPPAGSLLRRFSDIHAVKGWTGEYEPELLEEAYICGHSSFEGHAGRERVRMSLAANDRALSKSITDHDLLVQCVGYNFGSNPEERLPDIRRDRGGYGYTVAHRMRLSAADVVLDIGSGCGFVGRSIAPQVKALHCADISQSFLSFCSRELAEFPNVECHLIKYADFSSLSGKGINRVYSTAVWIHFNFFDMFHYLTALSELLPVGGAIYFDYADAAYLPGPDKVAFRDHAANYKTDRTVIQALLQYTSLPAVEKALSMTGFSLDAVWNTHEDCRSVLATKI